MSEWTWLTTAVSQTCHQDLRILYYILFCCSSFLGFDKTKLESMEEYLKAVKLFRNDENSSEPEYSQVFASNSRRSE